MNKRTYLRIMRSIDKMSKEDLLQLQEEALNSEQSYSDMVSKMDVYSSFTGMSVSAVREDCAYYNLYTQANYSKAVFADSRISKSKDKEAKKCQNAA